MGIVTLWYLDDGIDEAKWLTHDEKQVLKDHIAAEKQEKTRHSLRDGLLDWRVWLFGFVYFCFVAGLYGISFWLPQMIKSYRSAKRILHRVAHSYSQRSGYNWDVMDWP